MSCSSVAELIFTQYDQHCSILLAEFKMSRDSYSFSQPVLKVKEHRFIRLDLSKSEKKNRFVTFRVRTSASKRYIFPKYNVVFFVIFRDGN